MSAIRARQLAFAYALCAGAITALFLLRMPVQLTDSFTEFLVSQSGSIWQIMRPEFIGGPYMRPFRRGLITIVFHLSRGDYYLWFRGLHAAQVVALLLLVVAVLRVRTASDAAVIPLTMAMVLGFQTFADVVREAFPINHFLTIMLACVGSMALSQSKGGRIVDAAALVLLIFSMFTIESGLLVWVVLEASHFLGWRGVSRGALLLVSVTIAAYFVVRFGVGHGTVPGITERTTGFGFGLATPEALRQAFGDRLWPFYGYNVISAICCVLFAEPRGGVWLLTRAAVNGGIALWQIVTVVTSTLTTAVIAWYIAQRAGNWRRRVYDDDDRIVLLFLVLLPANAAFAAVYEKDVILSVAGLFYGMAAAVALRALLARASQASWSNLRRSVAFAIVAVLATGWTLRSVGIDYRLRQVARTDRNEWTNVHEWEASQGIRIDTPAQRAIEQALYDDAIWRVPSPPVVVSRVADRLFDPLQ